MSDAIELQSQLQEMFEQGGFTLRKWNSSDLTVLENVPFDLKDVKSSLPIASPEEYTKTLGVEWNPSKDHFRLTVSSPPPSENLTKRGLISDVAKTYDVLGWFAPVTIKVKILFQRLWELKLEWDDPVPEWVRASWHKWRTELPLLSYHHIPRCHYHKEATIVSTELHGFSDASELAYSGVVYLRMIDSVGNIYVSIFTSKTKVAPIKRLSIPRLELCGAQLLARLLHHIHNINPQNLYAWTDSTIVLNWLDGNPRRFKTYVVNRISNIIELIPSIHWKHVNGQENPADCASRGLYPSELLDHSLWWKGPPWLYLDSSEWPKQATLQAVPPELSCEEKVSLHSTLIEKKK